MLLYGEVRKFGTALRLGLRILDGLMLAGLEDGPANGVPERPHAAEDRIVQEFHHQPRGPAATFHVGTRFDALGLKPVGDGSIWITPHYAIRHLAEDRRAFRAACYP